MLLRINKKIFFYFFLFIFLGTLNNKNFYNFELPKINKIDKKKFYDFILKDKKHQSKKLNFVLLEGIGKPVIDINVQKNLILKSLDVII